MAAQPPRDIFVEDDDAAQVSYAPEGAWTRVGGRPQLYRGGTYHQTDVFGARATFRFTGTFVAYYSDSNTDHGNFTISLDGAPVATLSSHSSALISNQLLFSALVPPGTHALTLMNDAQGGVVGVDYFVYHASPPNATSTTSASASATPTTTTAAGAGSDGGLAPAAATGVALGATAGAALLVLGTLALRQRMRARRRRRRAREVSAVLASC